MSSPSSRRKPWSTALQLGLGFAAVLAMLLTVVLVARQGLVRENEAVKGIYQGRAVPLSQLNEVVSLGLRDRVLVMDMILRPEPANIAKRSAEVRKNRDTVAQRWEAYRRTVHQPDELATAKAFEAASSAYMNEGIEPALVALGQGDIEAAKGVLVQKISPLAPAFFELGGKLVALQVDGAAAAFEQSQAHARNVELTMAGLAVGALLLGAGLATLITRRLVRRLGAEPADLCAVADRITLGDLSRAPVAPPVPGSVMASLEAMRLGLVDVVATVRGGVEAVASASTQIAQGNLELSTRTEEQAASLEQTASSMEEFSSSIGQSVDSARQASALAVSASGAAARGGEEVSLVVTTMEEINAASNRIADIIGVIDGIAFQTNILALNAAVEAARAGEEGRGFAVVASEVRSLAQRSAQAAKEIKGLVGENVEKVERGALRVKQAGETVGEIVASVERVAQMIGGVSTAAAEQSGGISQVNATVAQLDQMTQQNAAMVEESAAAAQSLSAQAARLSKAVAVFHLP